MNKDDDVITFTQRHQRVRTFSEKLVAGGRGACVETSRINNASMVNELVTPAPPTSKSNAVALWLALLFLKRFPLSWPHHIPHQPTPVARISHSVFDGNPDGGPLASLFDDLPTRQRRLRPLLPSPPPPPPPSPPSAITAMTGEISRRMPSIAVIRGSFHFSEASARNYYMLARVYTLHATILWRRETQGFPPPCLNEAGTGAPKILVPQGARTLNPPLAIRLMDRSVAKKCDAQSERTCHRSDRQKALLICQGPAAFEWGLQSYLKLIERINKSPDVGLWLPLRGEYGVDSLPLVWGGVLLCFATVIRRRGDVPEKNGQCVRECAIIEPLVTGFMGKPRCSREGRPLSVPAG
ncbi:hypothetical protein V9T40_009142 [Parthenolecanium corni]|uniref:Uncharacterized protein n=1 Tax=Parthenolecanium corni TaxID=536013 RepID=A0AAN9Y788_9HEMI